MANKGYILMLEGDEHDREISKTYFDTQKISVEFLKFSNEVVPVLNEQQKNNALPDVILLSMNSLPETGLTVLKQIKTNNHFKHIPIVVLGEDTLPDLIKQCYANGANTFINKPFSNQLTDLRINSFIQYWFDVAELPVNENSYSKEKI